MCESLCYESNLGVLHVQENISAFDQELPPECLSDIEVVYRKYKDPTMS